MELMRIYIIIVFFLLYLLSGITYKSLKIGTLCKDGWVRGVTYIHIWNLNFSKRVWFNIPLLCLITFTQKVGGWSNYLSFQCIISNMGLVKCKYLYTWRREGGSKGPNRNYDAYYDNFQNISIGVILDCSVQQHVINNNEKGRTMI